MASHPPESAAAAAASTTAARVMEQAGATTAADGTVHIHEGQADILFGSQNDVFYNPVQVLNRDLSIQVLRLFAEDRARQLATVKLGLARRSANKSACGAPFAFGLTREAVEAGGVDWTAVVEQHRDTHGLEVLEALSATGLRSVRYAKEIEGLKSVIANDIKPEAVEAIRANVEANGVSLERVVPNLGDAMSVMYSRRTPAAAQFDVVDLDPYGSASIFLDGAVQCVRSGGVLCITCTDGKALAGVDASLHFQRYGGMPARGSHVHESKVRQLLASVETAAAKYTRHIQPLLSLAIDFYVRVFVRVVDIPQEVRMTATNFSMCLQCVDCEAFYMEPLAEARGESVVTAHGPACGGRCSECGGAFRMAGPMWNAPIHDLDFVRRLRDRVGAVDDSVVPTQPMLHGLLTKVAEELPDAPLFYKVDKLCRSLKVSSPPTDTFMSALLNAGYRVSHQNYEPLAVKTDAPPQAVYDVLRCWAARGEGVGAAEEGSLAARLRAKAPTLQADFTRSAQLPRKLAVARFPLKPKFWGPKRAAHGAQSDENREAKRRKKLEARKAEKAERSKSMPCLRLQHTGECSKEGCPYLHSSTSSPASSASGAAAGASATAMEE